MHEILSLCSNRSPLFVQRLVQETSELTSKSHFGPTFWADAYTYYHKIIIFVKIFSLFGSVHLHIAVANCLQVGFVLLHSPQEKRHQEGRAVERIPSAQLEPYPARLRTQLRRHLGELVEYFALISGSMVPLLANYT